MSNSSFSNNVFKRLVLLTSKYQRLFRKGLTHSQTMTPFDALNIYKAVEKEPFENNVGKEENADTQHFLLFPQCFLFYQEQILPFGSPFICCLQML